MKATEVMAELANLIAAHGDIDVKISITPYEHQEILAIQHGWQSELISAGEAAQYDMISIIPETETLE